MFFIGIDIGTTNCKVCLFELPEFKQVDKYSFKTPKIIEEDRSDFDVTIIWNKIKAGLEKITSQIDDVTKVVNISIASVGESGVLIDKQGEIIGPVITWYDRRTTTQLNDICQVIKPESIYDITGIPPHSNYSINKLIWIKEHYPDKFKSAYKWFCMSDYIVFKLTGEMKMDYSLASRTMLLDLETKSWSSEILDKLGIDLSLFPDLIESGATVGSLLPSVANEVGLDSKVKVSIGGHDHMCGSLTVGMHDENIIMNSTGTTEGLLILQNEPNLDQDFFKSYLSNGVHVLSSFYTIYASLPTGGYALEWFKNNFFSEKTSFDELTNRLDENLNKAFSSKKKLIFIPHLRGSGPPARTINSQGLFYGLTESDTKIDLLRAVFEGLCFELKTLFQLIEDLLDTELDSMKVIGPACKNRFWLQMKANILNKKVVAYELDEAVAKGAALLAAYKEGYIKDLEEVNMAKEVKVFKPDSNRVDYYQKIYEKLYRPFYNFKTDLELSGKNLID